MNTIHLRQPEHSMRPAFLIVTLGKLRNPALCSHVRLHRMFLSYLRIHPSIKQHAQIFEPVLSNELKRGNHL